MRRASSSFKVELFLVARYCSRISYLSLYIARHMRPWVERGDTGPLIVRIPANDVFLDV